MSMLICHHTHSCDQIKLKQYLRSINLPFKMFMLLNMHSPDLTIFVDWLFSYSSCYINKHTRV
jgi:hypothetical protein